VKIIVTITTTVLDKFLSKKLKEKSFGDNIIINRYSS